jgi:hypothetical protein
VKKSQVNQKLKRQIIFDDNLTSDRFIHLKLKVSTMYWWLQVTLLSPTLTFYIPPTKHGPWIFSYSLKPTHTRWSPCYSFLKTLHSRWFSSQLMVTQTFQIPSPKLRQGHWPQSLTPTSSLPADGVSCASQYFLTPLRHGLGLGHHHVGTLPAPRALFTGSCTYSLLTFILGITGKNMPSIFRLFILIPRVHRTRHVFMYSSCLCYT